MTFALRFVVFSFNRWRFLRHCVESIERHAPGAAILVYDDASDDVETLAILEDIGRRHVVVRPGLGGQCKHGGLYANMQAALDALDDAGPPVCFLQDDMQVVRPVRGEDLSAIGHYFAQEPDAGFLHPAFMKGCNSRRDRRSTGFDVRTGTYRRKNDDRRVGVYYSDVFIGCAGLLRARGWRFGEREGENEDLARKLFAPMGFLFAPFVMWLPNVPAYRGRTKTLALRVAERRRACGFYPIAPMPSPVVERLRSRPPECLPVAEDFLSIAPAELPLPWRYHPFQGAKLLQGLDRAERALVPGRRSNAD